MRSTISAVLGAVFLASASASASVPAPANNEQANSAVQFEIGLDRPVTLFSQAGYLTSTKEEPAPPLFLVCSLAESQAPVDVLLFPNDGGVSEQHPAVKNVQVQPGSCVFASGGHIEAKLVEDAYKAADWVNERISSFKEEERPSEEDRALQLTYENSAMNKLQAFLEVTPVRR